MSPRKPGPVRGKHVLKLSTYKITIINKSHDEALPYEMATITFDLPGDEVSDAGGTIEILDPFLSNVTPFGSSSESP